MKNLFLLFFAILGLALTGQTQVTDKQAPAGFDVFRDKMPNVFDHFRGDEMTSTTTQPRCDSLTQNDHNSYIIS
jgi:hypothetical protein